MIVNGRTLIFQVRRTAELWGVKVRPNRAVPCRTKYGNKVRQRCKATIYGNNVRKKRTANFRCQYLGNRLSDLDETLSVFGPHLCSKSVKFLFKSDKRREFGALKKNFAVRWTSVRPYSRSPYRTISNFKMYGTPNVTVRFWNSERVRSSAVHYQFFLRVTI